MAGPAAGEGRGGGVATVEAAGGAAGGGARGAAAGGGRGGSSPLANARGTSWSPSSRTFPVATGRGRGVVAAAKGSGVADDRASANSSGGPTTVATEFKQAAQTVSSASAPAAGPTAAPCVAIDGGSCLRGKRAAGSPTSRRLAPGSEDDALISSRIAAIAQQLEWAAAATSPETAAAPGALQQLPARGAAPGTPEPRGPSQEDFAVEVNECFQKMYSGAYSVDLVVSLLQRLSQAPLGGRDSSLFLAMLRTLFFECRHFPRYPTQQLLLTAELFGKLIASQVLLHQPSANNSVAAANPSSLVIALRCVLEALRKGPNSKMFLFGVAALEQVLTRLYLFPDFLVSLSRLPPHFNLQCPHYTAYVENLLLLIPKRLHRCVYLDPATAAAALPPIPDPPASRGPGATNLTPAVISAAAPTPGITPPVAGLQQQPHQQQGLPHASPAGSSPTAAAIGCLQNTKAAPAAAPGLKPGDGGGERAPAAEARGAPGLEQQRRQQLQTAGLPQQQGPCKGPRQGGTAASSEIGTGGTAVLGSGTAAANPGDAAGGGGVQLHGGAGTRPFFGGGAAGMGAGGLCVTPGEQSIGVGGACVVQGGHQLHQEQGTMPSAAGGGGGGAAAATLQQQQITAGGDPNTLVLGGGGLTTPPTAIGALLQGVGLGQVEGLMNDRELLAKLVLPPQWLAEQVIAACNSVCEANVDDKATALRHVLAPEHQAWLAFYLVKSRASKEPNLHAIFFLFVEKLEMPGLPEVVVSMSYDCINTLLKYLAEAKESSSYRTLLKNLGLWLGRITLGRNRPLMSKRLDLKSLLFRGYDEGHLVAVLPLVCKVLEGVRLSKVFKPPNPWTTAMLSLLAELQQLPNLRTNLIFEVEVLFKHLHINVQDYHGRSHHLARRAVPAASPDFVVRTAVPALDATAAAAGPPTTATAGAAAPAGVKPVAAALNIPGAAATSLLTAGPPPGIVGPTATLASTAAAAQQQPTTTAAAGPPSTGGLRAAAPAHACATATCAAPTRGPGTTTPERGAGGAAGVAAEGGVAAGAVCSRLLRAAAASNTAAAQKLQQQQQRGPSSAAGGQLLDSHQAGGSRLAMDAVTAGLRTSAAASGGAGPAAAGPLQQQMLSQQQLLAQRQQFPQLQSQGGGGPTAADAAGAAAALRGSAARAADETLLQHHQRLLAAASAVVGNGSAADGVPSTSEDAESLAAAGRRDPRSLLLAAAMRGAAAGETSSLFMSSGGGGAGAYPQQQTAVERSGFASSTTYTGEPQGSVPQAWPSLQEEQQGGADAAALGAGANASLLNLLQQQQQQAGSGGAGATLLEQQPQVAAAGGPPPPPAQKSSAGTTTVQQQHHPQATQGSPYHRLAAAGGVAGGSSSSGVMEGAMGGGASPPSLFGGGSAAAEAFAAGAGTSSLMPSDSLLQNLAQNVVISPSIALLSLQPGLRPLVPLAVERAVREIISAVAERSVTISCVTTRELVCKDFCMEGEESLVKRAAHLMVASLAGSLALITCREPLRVSLTQNLRQLLQPVASTPECGDQVLVEQVLQIVSTDNLDLGCSVIEQAVVEKVLRDIEISMQPALLLRRQAKERGVPFVDTQYVNSGRWPMALPEPLKLHPLLNTRQLQVYKDFMLIGPLRKMHQQHLYGAQQQQQQHRSSGCQQQQQQMATSQQQHGLGGAGGVATSTAGSLASGSGRESGESGGGGGMFGAAAAGGTLLSAAAAAPARLSSGPQQQQQQREAIQQMAATVAAARALNQQQQQQQKLLQLQQQGAPPGHATDLADGLGASARQHAAGAAGGGLAGAAAGASPQQQGRGSLNAQQSSYGAGAAAAAGLNMQQQISQYAGQEQSLSVLMLKLEGCLVQLRDVVRDIFNSPPVMPTASTTHRFSYPAGCQMHALPVPPCSTSALLVFACLPSNHELFQLIASVSSVASSCSRMDEVAPALAHKLIKSVFEGAALAAHRGVVGSALRGVDPTGLYMEVFFAVLAALRRESEVVGKLAGEVLSISCASATLPPKRSNVAVAAGLMRYGLIDFSAFDGVLASHLEGGRNAPVVEFVLVLLKVLQDQHAVSPAALRNTFKTLAAADALPPRVVQLRGWQCLSLTEARDRLLETFHQREIAENKEGLPHLTTLTQLMDDYCVPAYPVKVRCLPMLPDISAETQQLVRRIFEDWVRLCTVPTSLSLGGGAAAAAGAAAGGGGNGFSWVTQQRQQQQSAAQAGNLFLHRRAAAGTSDGGGGGGAAAAAAGVGGAVGGQQQACSNPVWGGDESVLLLRAMFFQKVSQQGLLRMDEDTDRFFAVCVDVAVEKATVMLRLQGARNSSSSTQHAAAAAGGATPAATKDGAAASSSAEATGTLSAACGAATGNGVPTTPHSQNRSSSNSTGERTPQQQRQQQQQHTEMDSETCEEAGGNASTFVEKIASGELSSSSSSTSEGQRSGDSALSSSSSSNSTGAGASQKRATTGLWAATVAGGGKKSSAAEDGRSEAAENSDQQLKKTTPGGAQEEQEKIKQQQEHQEARSTTTGSAAAADADAAEGEQQQQQQQRPAVGILAADPTISAEALAAMETPPEETEAPLDAVPLDSLAKMIAAMMRFVDPQQVSPVLILQRALGVVCRHIHMQAEVLGSSFNQRPYFRLLLSILLEVTTSAFPSLTASGAPAAGDGSSSGGGGVAVAAGAAAGGSSGSQQQQQQQSSSSSSNNSSDGENAAGGTGTSTPRGGAGAAGEGGGDPAAAAVAQQQLLLQQSILTFADHLALLCPMRVPAFAFAWLELVGHRTFLPLLLRGPSGMRGNPRSGWVALHKLLLLHFEFMHPFLASVSLSDSVRQLYKGTLRVLLVLLHDFPEYLCETYVDCCSVLPLNCVQLRNVILSAFPRNMRLPDPFLPNLRVDLLPEVKMVPRLLLTHSFYSVLLLHQRQKQQLLKNDVDLYWQSRDPALLPRIRKKLLLPSKAEALKRGTKYDVPLFNAFLLYVATSVPEHDPRSCGSISSAVLPPGPLPPALDGSCSSSNSNGAAPAAAERGGANGSNAFGGYGADSSSSGCGCSSVYRVHSGGDISNASNGLTPEGGSALLSPALEIILYLAKELDMEGRYLLMSGIANHLRYPNAHTHFFSNLLLWLFSESKEELVQEQITRVLLERLIVHRPHPWGLLITFIELIKNPRFAFWSCLFVSAAPEVEKLFQSVAHTCLGQSGAQQLQQQRQR